MTDTTTQATLSATVRYVSVWERVKAFAPQLADELDQVVGELLVEEEDRVRAEGGPVERILALIEKYPAEREEMVKAMQAAVREAARTP